MTFKEVKKSLIHAMKKSDHPKTIAQYSQKLGYDEGKDYGQFVQYIAELQRKGVLLIDDEGVISFPPKKQTLEGTFLLHKKGYGFVQLEDKSKVYIAAALTGGAMNEDKVTVELIKKGTDDKNPEGKVVSIQERAMMRLVGEFQAFNETLQEKSGDIGQVFLKNKGMDRFTCLVEEEGLHPSNGEMVVLEIVSYPNEEHPFQLTGRVIHGIGQKDAPGVEILSVLNMMAIPHDFPQDVVEEAEKIREDISSEELKGRMDFRKALTITIDGADAKDLDDAISYQELTPTTIQLGVHIADVSHYVTEGSALDKEAVRRGTSVYLTDRVVPMLPQRLSNGICSLQEGQERLTMSCVMTIDKKTGEILAYKIGPSVIQSNHRMVYDDVNLLLKGDARLSEKYADSLDMLKGLANLHQVLWKRRHKRGAIDFEKPEAKIKVDATGFPIAIEVRERGLAERMIESFMLAANETVAYHYRQKRLPFIYRIHEYPDDQKVQAFIEFCHNLGIKVPVKEGRLRSKDLQQILEGVQGKDYAPVVQTIALRSMQQARYSSSPNGHYGLAAEDYTHFTSPIRRYPDLLGHRLIRYYQTHKGKGEEDDHLIASIDSLAEQSSKAERRAVDAEREVNSMKMAEYMSDKIGQKFEGMISAVTKFGLFVELSNTVEGLVHLSVLKDDYYIYDEKNMILIGKRTGKIYRIGDKVQAKLTRADKESRQIDFEFVKEGKSSQKKSSNKDKKTKRSKKQAVKPSSKSDHTKSFSIKKRHGHSQKKKSKNRKSFKDFSMKSTKKSHKKRKNRK